MKILHISLRSDIGGGPEHVYQLSNKLSEASNFSLFIAGPNEKPYFDKFKHVTNNNVFELPHRKFSVSSLLKLRKYIIDNKIAIVHSHGKGAGIYSRILKISYFKIKIVHTFHGWHVGNYNTVALLFYNMLEILLGLCTDKFISVSNSEFNNLPSLFRILNSKKITIIPNGVQIFKNDVSFKEKTIDILIITRFDYQKNFDLAIEFSKVLPDVKFVVLGNLGQDGKKYIRICNENNISNVSFEGGTDKVREYMLKSKIILSTSRWEGLSLGILEAMSEGCVPILSSVTGNNELEISKELFYDLGSYETVINKIKLLLTDENDWNLSSNNAKTIVKNKYSLNSMSKRVEDIYQSL